VAQLEPKLVPEPIYSRREVAALVPKTLGVLADVLQVGTKSSQGAAVVVLRLADAYRLADCRFDREGVVACPTPPYRRIPDHL
jgi:hypothetical protein